VSMLPCWRDSTFFEKGAAFHHSGRSGCFDIRSPTRLSVSICVPHAHPLIENKIDPRDV
jgi:hypothetical protein